MIAQSHKILRQVLEVRGCPRDDERRIGAELRNLYFQRVVPVLEKVCSEVGSPGHIHRIGRLEVDLGRLPLAGLEPHFGDRFEAVFGRRLADALVSSARADSELELVEWFVRTGTLPWWADGSDPDAVASALARLLARDPGALVTTLRATPDPQRAWARVARAAPDPLLEQLTLAMAPSLRTVCADVRAFAAAVRTAQGGRADSVAVRHVVWEEVLRAAEAHEASGGGEARFVSAVVARVARRGGRDYPAMVRDLHRTLSGGAPGTPAGMREVVDDLLADLGRTVAGAYGGAGSRPAGAPPSRTPAPPGEDAREADALDDAQRTRHRRSTGVTRGLPSEEVEADAGARERSGEARSAAAVLQRRTPTHGSAGLVHEVDSGPGRSGHGGASTAPTAPPRLDPTFSDVDAIYVDNAGLVILWPFLERFFDRLELLHGRRFTDDAAAHRAAGLLQLVAGTEGTPPEHLVTLNKVLCGIAPDDVFDFGDDVTDAEAEECEDLLRAVIHQAPVLRNMSTAGFRGSFLLRKGQLSTRDGHWLLRVERETHDIVLDRFPWSVGVIKLPWMAALLQVEW